jgi:hypothetical protein
MAAITQQTPSAVPGRRYGDFTKATGVSYVREPSGGVSVGGSTPRVLSLVRAPSSGVVVGGSVEPDVVLFRASVVTSVSAVPSVVVAPSALPSLVVTPSAGRPVYTRQWMDLRVTFTRNGARYDPTFIKLTYKLPNDRGKLGPAVTAYYGSSSIVRDSTGVYRLQVLTGNTPGPFWARWESLGDGEESVEEMEGTVDRRP